MKKVDNYNFVEEKFITVIPNNTLKIPIYQ